LYNVQLYNVFQNKKVKNYIENTNNKNTRFS